MKLNLFAIYLHLAISFSRPHSLQPAGAATPLHYPQPLPQLKKMKMLQTWQDHSGGLAKEKTSYNHYTSTKLKSTSLWGLTNYSDCKWFWGSWTDGHWGNVYTVDTGIRSLVFILYWGELKICHVEYRLAKRWQEFSGVLVGVRQIEETPRISGMGRASDGKAAALVDWYFVRAVDHHSMRRRQGDAGLVQLYCRIKTGFLQTKCKYVTHV